MTVDFTIPAVLRANIHVVLIEPGESLNVGSVARVMSNFGFDQLTLVAPPRLDLDRAQKTARHGKDLFAKMSIARTIPEVLAPMQEVVGFSGQHGKHRPNHILLHEWLDSYGGTWPGQTALVFGPEDTGLTQDHLAHCRTIVRIPSAAHNASFNLAQSVLIALLEIVRRHWTVLKTDVQPASWNDYAQLDRIMTEVLTISEFYRDGTPKPIPDLVCNLMRRTKADQRELSVLMALFNRILTTLKRNKSGDAGGENSPCR